MSIDSIFAMKKAERFLLRAVADDRTGCSRSEGAASKSGINF